MGKIERLDIDGDEVDEIIQDKINEIIDHLNGEKEDE